MRGLADISLLTQLGDSVSPAKLQSIIRPHHKALECNDIRRVAEKPAVYSGKSPLSCCGYRRYVQHQVTASTLAGSPRHPSKDRLRLQAVEKHIAEVVMHCSKEARSAGGEEEGNCEQCKGDSTRAIKRCATLYEDDEEMAAFFEGSCSLCTAKGIPCSKA